MAGCDVCSGDGPATQGYLLTTAEVVERPSYWEHAFRHQWSYVGEADPSGQALPMLVRQQAGQPTAWFVCGSCIGLFDVDRNKARQACERWIAAGQPSDFRLPGAGQASHATTLRAATSAWQKVFGGGPSAGLSTSAGSASPTPTGSSSCFIATAACGSEGAAEVVLLRDLRDRYLLRRPWGRRFVAIYCRVSPPIARVVASSWLARRITRMLLVLPAARLYGRFRTGHGRSSGQP